MPMFWSRKSKAEKIYDQFRSTAKTAPVKTPKFAKLATKPTDKFVAKSTTKTSVKLPKEIVVAKEQAPAKPSGSFTKNTDAIIRPHITEKSGFLSHKSMYTFQIAENANKHLVSRAITALYKVNPVRVSIINLPNKSVFLRGKRGRVSGIRKAVVTLKKGEKINFI